MAFKIKIISVGKTKEAWLKNAIDEYLQRLQGRAQFECIWAKDDDQFASLVSREKHLIALDPAGEEMSSEGFAAFLQDRLESGGSRLTFAIGGDSGLPLNIKQSAPLLSLSKLTFTHQMTRLILVEQIYRALEINRGSQYHK